MAEVEKSILIETPTEEFPGPVAIRLPPGTFLAVKSVDWAITSPEPAPARKFEFKAEGPRETLVRHWIESHLPTAQIEEITVLATAVFEDESKAARWLSRINAATDGRPPIDLIGEENGYARVKNLLLRIEHGVLA